MILPLLMASPSPMFTTIFSRRGACIGLVNPNSFIRAGRTSFSYRSFNRRCHGRLSCAFGRRLLECRAMRWTAYLAACRLARRAFSLAPSSRATFSSRTALSPATTITLEMAMVPGLLDDAALRVGLAAALPDVALHRHELLDPDAPLLAEDLQHVPGLPLLLAGDHLDGVALADDGHGYRTSGARLMIFMNLRARSSRATGPKMRVPTGSRSLLMRTALLPSKRM